MEFVRRIETATLEYSIGGDRFVCLLCKTTWVGGGSLFGLLCFAYCLVAPLLFTCSNVRDVVSYTELVILVLVRKYMGWGG